MLLARSRKHLQVTNTYRHFPNQRPISRSTADAEERRARERLFCRNDLDFRLDINVRRYRHATSVVLQVAVHILRDF